MSLQDGYNVDSHAYHSILNNPTSIVLIYIKRMSEESSAGEGRRSSMFVTSGVALIVGSAAFLAKYLLTRDAYDGMDSIVSFSSRMIAGRCILCLFSYGGMTRYPRLDSLLFSFLILRSCPRIGR